MNKKFSKLIAFMCIFIAIITLNPLNVFAYEEKTDVTIGKTSVQVQKETNVDEGIEIVDIDMQDLLIKRMSMNEDNKDCKHEFDTIIVNPTCKRYGYTVGYCTNCNYTFIYNTTDLAPHKFTEFEMTFKGKPEKHRICTVCGYEEIKSDDIQTSRYFNGTQNQEPVWTSYKATQEERKEIEETIKRLGIIVEKDKLINDVPGYIWDFLMERIGNPNGVAGLMGNLFCESGLQSINLQNYYEGSLGYSDIEYINAVDNGDYSREEFSSDSAGFGLAQWTSSGRKANLYDFAKQTNRSIGDLDMQLEFLWQELINNYASMTSLLQNTSTVYEASTAVLTRFERPADQSESAKLRRTSYGEGYLYVYG